jgi:hypothetical protein
MSMNLTTREHVLVDARWLAAHLHDPAVRVVEVGRAGHVPSAVHQPIDGCSPDS